MITVPDCWMSVRQQFANYPLDIVPASERCRLRMLIALYKLE